jgi:hypothetical protein
VSGREERVARNESISREINEGIEEGVEEAMAPSPSDHIRVLCECGRLECERVVAITLAEYEQVRSDSRRFVVVKGHVMPDVEFVVDESDRFVVVEKREGTAAEVAEALDPRGGG